MKLMLIIGMLCILLVAGCQIPHEPTPEEIEKEQLEICEEEASKLIPEKLTLYQHGDWRIKELTWNDGLEASMKDYISIHYNEGSKTGENINLYYPSSLFDIDDSLLYSKQIVSEEGIVLGNNEFEVKLILKPIPNTEGKYQIWQDSPYPTYDTQEFEVVDYEILNCEWIE